jgi:zinc protease
VTGPEKDRSILPDSAALIAIMNEVNASSPGPYIDIDVSAPILSGNFTGKPVVQYSTDTTYGLYHWQFANGVKVTAKPTTFKNDEILMNAYSEGGHSQYATSMYPSARSASTVVGSSGVGNYNAIGLDKKLTGLRVNVSPFITERYEGFSGSSSVSELETMMQLTYAYATAFREDSVALNAYVNREKGMFANILANPGNWFTERVTKITTQNHPRRGFPTLESYEEISMDDIMSIYKDRFADLSDMHFFFVGNFEPDSLQKLTSRYLGALPGTNRKETWKDVGERMPSGKIDSTFHRGAAPKSLVQLVYHGSDIFHPDSGYVLQSLIDVARIKLREELREEEGGVYGVSISGGQTQFPIEQYAIRISFNAEPGRTAALVESAKNVIEKLKMEITSEDIHKVTETQRQGRIRDLQQNQFWMSSLVNSWINKVLVKEYLSSEVLETRIARLNEAILKRAAAKYFNNSELISVVMYPEKT